MFTFEKKEPHVARLVSLPPLPAYAHMTSADLAALPPLLVTTISIPTYPASIFAAGDGPNVTLVFYHVLPAEFNPATYENQVPAHGKRGEGHCAAAAARGGGSLIVQRQRRCNGGGGGGGGK